MISADEKRELREQAHELAYSYIRHSGLYRQLENEQWDALADKWATWVLVGLEGLVDGEFTRLESESQKVSK